MHGELTSLLENKAAGEAQVAARMASMKGLKGDEAELHKQALMREQKNLASIQSRIDEMQKQSDKPAT